MTPSFERLNYLLRANKNIEQKLVFDVLLRAQQSIVFPEPVYVGFGSMWFADFRLAHRVLGLETLVSIERPAHAGRADFNKPFDSISIKAGECLSVLRAFSTEDWVPPVFAWLDFDGRLTDDVASAIDVFLGSCTENSVLIVTVNAQRKRYSRDRIREQREQTSVAYLEQTLGQSVVDSKFEPRVTRGGKYEDVADDKFPELLADSLLSYMRYKLRLLARQSNGKAMSFVPLFSLCHEDGASMITVGGAICADAEVPSWRRCLEEHPVLENQDGSPVFGKLDLMPITLKEKLALDSCLPNPQEEFLDRVQKCGVVLPETQIEKYRLLNRHFPVFVESPI